MTEKNWSLQFPWNKSITTDHSRKFEPRDFLYAGEIGDSFLTTFWKMKGIEPTNKLSDGTRRKMEAGHFYEAVVVWVLERTGMLKETQGKVRLFDDRFLPVYGRFDILAGFDGDWNEAKKNVEDYFKRLDELNFNFPFYDIVRRRSFDTIEHMSQMYPEGLADKIIEVKSINSMAFWRNDTPISQPYRKHIIQLSFYQLFNSLGIKNGSFLYIDRDTMSVSEIPNIVTKETEDYIYEWLTKMTEYYKSNTEPPRPEFVLWNKEENKWEFNWEINRSEYKDKILEGVNVENLLARIKSLNADIKVKEKMRKAAKGEKAYGIKKYEAAIAMLDKSMSYEEVMKKTGVPLIALMHYVEDLKNEK